MRHLDQLFASRTRLVFTRSDYSRQCAPRSPPDPTSTSLAPSERLPIPGSSRLIPVSPFFSLADSGILFSFSLDFGGYFVVVVDHAAVASRQRRTPLLIARRLLFTGRWIFVFFPLFFCSSLICSVYVGSVGTITSSSAASLIFPPPPIPADL